MIPLSTQHYPMLQRNLVYTGVTRGKRLVVLLGQRKALAIAVKGAHSEALVEAGRVARAGGDHANAARRVQAWVSGLRGPEVSNPVRSGAESDEPPAPLLFNAPGSRLM